MTSHLSFSPPVIAHRGAGHEAPENTLSALLSAKAEGVSWVEFDVKITHDGVPILMHDESFERTTNGHGLVAETVWEHVIGFSAGKGHSKAIPNEPVPRLSDALRVAMQENLKINIELKPCAGRSRATTMVALIEAAKVWPDFHPLPLISSFDIESLEIAAQFQPHWPRGLLLDEWREDWPDLVSAAQITALHFNEKLLTPERLGKLLPARLPVLAYTVNDVNRAKELLGMGVSAVFSDFPREIVAQL